MLEDNTVPLVKPLVKERYRAVFVSDLHMGSRAFDCVSFLDFITRLECNYLYLVGDIIDGWKYKKRKYWPQPYDHILSAILDLADRGTVVTYLPGNHDSELREISNFMRIYGYRRFGMRVANTVIHTTVRGERLLVLHGDQFDRAILRGRTSQWSDHLYDSLMDVLGWAKPGIKRGSKNSRQGFSLAKIIRRSGHVALAMLNDFERMAHAEAMRAQADGVVCGHTHLSVLKKMPSGFLYANCGHWLHDRHTVLVEDDNGLLKIIHRQSVDAAGAADNQSSIIAMSDPLYNQNPERVARLREDLLSLWPSPKWAKPKAIDDIMMGRYYALFAKNTRHSQKPDYSEGFSGMLRSSRS